MWGRVRKMGSASLSGLARELGRIGHGEVSPMAALVAALAADVEARWR